MNQREHRGVRLTDRPLDANNEGDTVIAIEIPLSEAELDQYKWKDEGKAYRKWLVPAAVINKNWWPKLAIGQANSRSPALTATNEGRRYKSVEDA